MLMATTTRDPYAPAPQEITAQAEKIMRRPYRKIITGDADEGFLIEVPDLPGCMTAGETLEEAARMLPEAMLGWLEAALMGGDPIPEPSTTHTYSGKMLLRMSKSLHRRLIEKAQDEGVSANQLAVTLLAKAL